MGDERTGVKSTPRNVGAVTATTPKVGAATLTSEYGDSTRGVSTGGNSVWQNAGLMEETLYVIAQDPVDSTVGREAQALIGMYRQGGMTDAEWVPSFLLEYKRTLFPDGATDQDRRAYSATHETQFRASAERAVKARAIPSVNWAIDQIRGQRRTWAQNRGRVNKPTFDADRKYQQDQQAERAEHLRKRNESLYVRGRHVLDQLERLDAQLKSRNGFVNDPYLGHAAAAALRSLGPMRDALATSDDDANKYFVVWAALYGSGGGPPTSDDETFGPLFGRPARLGGSWPEQNSARGRLLAFPKHSDPASEVEKVRAGAIKSLELAARLVSSIPHPYTRGLGASIFTAASGLKYAAGEIDGTQLVVELGVRWLDAAIGVKMTSAASTMFRRLLTGALWGVAREEGPKIVAIFRDERLSVPEKADRIARLMPEIVKVACINAVGTMLAEVAVMPPETRLKMIDSLIGLAKDAGIYPYVAGALVRARTSAAG